MERPDDPPGPENPGAVALLVLFPSVLVLLLFALAAVVPGDAWVDCAQNVRLAPELLSGGLCGVLSSAVVAAPLWILAGSPRSEAVVEDENGLEWRRPRVHGRLVAPVVFATPALLGMALGVFVPRVHGSMCEIEDFDHGHLVEETWIHTGPAERSCLDSGLSRSERSACRSSWLGFAAEGGAAGAFLLFVGLAASRTRSRIRDIALDAQGVTLDGRRIAYADLDDVTCSDRALVFVPFEGPEVRLDLRTDEVAFARWVCARVRALLPDTVEDRTADRDRLASLERPSRTERD